MISTTFNDSTFVKEMNNIVRYAEGYLEGVKAGSPVMLNKIGRTLREVFEEYVDASARVDPARLHHVYEWYQAGSPNARLFDIDYAVVGNGLSFNATFRQSKSFSDGSTVPFYNKAYIMENGIPVTIKPKRAGGVLAFEDNGEAVFTKSPISVNAPGGKEVQGSFSDVMQEFFGRYLTQSYLTASGFTRYIETPADFKKNMAKGKSGGKAVGRQIGYNWIVKAGDQI